MYINHAALAVPWRRATRSEVAPVFVREAEDDLVRLFASE